jgi:uncharacterized protein (DUF2267 family)
VEFDFGAFTRAVMDRAAITEAWRAERVVEVTLEALGARVADADRVRVARLVPAPLGEMLSRRSFVASDELADLLAEVGAAEGVDDAFAVEHVGSVCSLLAERLPADATTALCMHLPAAVAALFTGREEGTPPPARAARHGRRRSISEAHASSAHPLFESRAERAHGESVAKSDAPHADTKLSSTRGTTQVREKESLAEARPGSEDPLSEGGD